jgi:dihydrofolate reductase
VRTLRYHVAATLDGYIAKMNGSFDCFPVEGDHIADYLDSLKSYDTVLMGRKTYEVALKGGVSDPYPQMRSIVFSRSMTEAPDPRIELVRAHADKFVRELKELPGGDIYLCGGAELATHLFQAGLVDAVTVKINPILLGSGIPLLLGLDAHVSLELTDTKRYDSGVVLLSYLVQS